MENMSVRVLKMMLVVSVIALGSVSCQVMRHQPMSVVEMDRRSSELELALLGLRGVDAAGADVIAEVNKIARVCVVEGENFAQENRAVRPSWLNNCLVNVGIHRSGLCWHYRNHLYDQLHAMNRKYFEVHTGVRDKGRTFHEHHCVVIVPAGGGFHDGLVIDPWQESGRTIWFATQGERGEWSYQPRWAEAH